MKNPNTRIGTATSEGKIKQIPLETAVLFMNKFDIMNPKMPLYTPQEFIVLVEEFGVHGVIPAYSTESYKDAKTGKDTRMIIKRSNICNSVDDIPDAINQVGEALKKLFPDLYNDAPKRDRRVSTASGKEYFLYESDQQYKKAVIDWAKKAQLPCLH